MQSIRVYVVRIPYIPTDYTFSSYISYQPYTQSYYTERHTSTILQSLFANQNNFFALFS